MSAPTGQRPLMISGQPYIASDPDLLAGRRRAQSLLHRFNVLSPSEGEEAQAILRELLGSLGESVQIMPPFRCDYGDYIAIGPRTFINYDCIVLDCAPVTIGADVQIAPRVQIVTAEHPLDPEVRRTGVESARPVVIGDAVWLGAGVIVCPGVTIGEGTVVGAGSVVTRDLPPGVIVVGIPCRPVREIRPSKLE